MPSLVCFLAISASIHLIPAIIADAIKTSGLRGACERAVELRLFSPVLLAALTTAFNLGSLALSAVTPISKFGIYAALGVATLVLTLPVLPAFLPDIPSRKLLRPLRSTLSISGRHDREVVAARVGGQLVRYRTSMAWAAPR